MKAVKELHILATASFKDANFSVVEFKDFTLVMSTDDVAIDFIEKNNIKARVDLTELSFPDGLSKNDDKRAFLGLAAGARAIHQAEEQSTESGNVVVHCRAGKERTPSTVAYYLIRYHGLEGQKAVALVRSALQCRFKGDIFETSSALPRYYGWLQQKNQSSLKAYEARPFIVSGAEHQSNLSEHLSSLFDVKAQAGPSPAVFTLKKEKAFNGAIRALHEAKKQTKALDSLEQEPSAIKKPGDAIVEEKIDRELDAAPKLAKSRSSTAGILNKINRQSSMRSQPKESGISSGPSSKITSSDQEKEREAASDKFLGTYQGTSGKVRFASPPKVINKKQAGVLSKAKEPEDMATKKDSPSESSSDELEESASSLRSFRK